MRSTLKQMPDIERALSRLALGRGGPRDLGTLSNGLIHATKVEGLLEAQILPSLLSRVTVDLLGHDDLCSELGSALVAEPPLLARDGEFVAASYSATLDEIKSLRDKARSVIARMQAEYASASSISTLKIKHNNVLGYFIETTAAHAQRMLAAPLSATFIHRQTTASAVRFTTVDLGELETKILNAAGRATRA